MRRSDQRLSVAVRALLWLTIPGLSVAQLPAAPGRLVDVGDGQRLHLRCTGRGAQTVVFENGAGDFSLVWALVQSRVAEFARVCSYDRAGYAWSDPGAQPRTFSQMTLELRTALERAGERGPYILVGQSYGGLVVRGYAQRYPSDVAGMVLVDAVHEDQRVRIGTRVERIRDSARGRIEPQALMRLDTAGVVLRRSVHDRAARTPPLGAPLDRLPPAAQDAWRLAAADTVYRLTWSAEMDWSPEELSRMHTERETNRATLGDLPLVVISRAVTTPADSFVAERAALQRDLVALSSRATHVVAARAGHNVHLEEPTLVVEAIRRVVRAVERGRAVRP
jgi:pimeloyl-ACP methyl ester carboxylesterase